MNYRSARPPRRSARSLFIASAGALMRGRVRRRVREWRPSFLLASPITTSLARPLVARSPVAPLMGPLVGMIAVLGLIALFGLIALAPAANARGDDQNNFSNSNQEFITGATVADNIESEDDLRIWLTNERQQQESFTENYFIKLTGQLSKRESLNKFIDSSVEQMRDSELIRARLQRDAEIYDRAYSSFVSVLLQRPIKLIGLLVGYNGNITKAIRGTHVVASMKVLIIDRLAQIDTELKTIATNIERLKSTSIAVGATIQQDQTESANIAVFLKEKTRLLDALARSIYKSDLPVAQKIARVKEQQFELDERTKTIKRLLRTGESAVTIQADFRPLRELRRSLAIPARGRFSPPPPGYSKFPAYIETSGRIPVTSPIDGVVSFAGRFGSNYWAIIIELGVGDSVTLAGIGPVLVKAGDIVLAGETIAHTLPETQLTTGGETASARSLKPIIYVEFRENNSIVGHQRFWRDNAVLEANN